MRKIILLFFLLSFLTGCAVNLPFDTRLSYSALREIESFGHEQERQKIAIVWIPSDFPYRIDRQSSGGFGDITNIKIPTGVIMSSRIQEAVSTFADIAPDGKKLTMTVVEAQSGFKYLPGSIPPSIDVGTMYFKVDFDLNGDTWTKEYTSSKKYSAIDFPSQTGALEAAWEDVAIQVAKDIAEHMKR